MNWFNDDYLVDRGGFLIFDSSRLGEPSSIAHSALMMLALLHSPPPRRLQQITALADGILRQQKPDGSYMIHFENSSNQGEELYAGEAMLAIIDAYKEYQDIRYLPNNVRSYPEKQEAVELACALEGLNEAYALACGTNNERADRYRENICLGLEYLIELQCTNKLAKKERGGFGLSTTDRSQRIDVVGHASSAFIKTVQNGIEC